MFQTEERIAGDAMTDNDRQMERWFSTYIGNFIRTSDPNGGDLPTWPMFDSAQFHLMDFTMDNGPVYEPDPRSARVELVERAADAMAAGP
jgi:para-nitrobenzyl esterase